LIYGMLEGMIGIGAAAGSWLAGYIFDQTQSYFNIQNLRLPLKMSFLRKQESISFWHYWTPVGVYTGLDTGREW